MKIRARIVRDDDWAEYLMHPVDPFDKRPAILIGAWPESVEVEADADWRASIEEHHTHDEDELAG